MNNCKLSSEIITVFGTEIHILTTDTTGDQLLDEDLEEGYVDYIDVAIDDIPTQTVGYDGGIMMSKKYTADQFKSDEEVADAYSKSEMGGRQYRIIFADEYERLMGIPFNEREA